MPTPLHNFWKRELTILSANFPKNLLALSYLNKHQSCIIEYKKEVPNASDAEILLIHVHIFIWLKLVPISFPMHTHRFYASDFPLIYTIHVLWTLYYMYMYIDKLLYHIEIPLSVLICIYMYLLFKRAKHWKKKYPIHIVLHTKTDSQQTFEPFQIMLHNDLC